jgi:hypothetical protein
MRRTAMDDGANTLRRGIREEKRQKKKKKQTLHSAATEIQEIKGKKRETEGPCTQ